MLWPILFDSVEAGQPAVARVDEATPYVFGVQFWREQSGVAGSNGVAFDFLVEDPGSGHYLQISLSRNRVITIDGLIVRRSSISSIIACYSAYRLAEQGVDPLFGLVPVATGKPPNVRAPVVKQEARISIDAYSDTLVFSFDDFRKAEGIALADGVFAEIDANSCLAGFAFSGEIGGQLNRRLRRP